MFFNCIYDSCSVKECNHLLSYVCSVHCDSTAAHLTRIIAEIVKQLKDSSDSRVRDACRDTIGALSRIYLKGNNTDAVVGLFVKPLFEAMRERNEVVQSGAAMCMAMMVESAASPPVTSFQKLCPRICKLLSNPCFLAKVSLLHVVSSLSQVGAIAPQSLESLLESIHDCLASTYWVTRKAAADTLTVLASHSCSLIEDKTDFTLAVLENCQFDKIKLVRESVTEALQLWKKISRKCVDGASDESKISYGEQLGSEKSGEKRADLADLMKKEVSDGSTLSVDSRTKGKSGLPEKKAVVMLNKKAPASSEKNIFQRLERRQSVEVVVPRSCKNYDEEEPEGSSSSNRGYWSAIQRQLLQLERQQSNLTNVVQEFIGGSHDNMVNLEGKVSGLEKIFEDMATDLSISSCHRSNLTAEFGKCNNSFPNYPTGKFNGLVPGDRSSQPDGAMRVRMWNPDMADNWFIPPHTASRNGQAGPSKPPRSDQHENEHMGNERRGLDDKASGTIRFGEGPSATYLWQASKDEAIRVAGEDGAVTRAARVVAVTEAAAMGAEENKGEEHAQICILWRKAVVPLYHVGDINSAYAEVFDSGDQRSIILLMETMGPTSGNMSNEIVKKALKFISQLLQDHIFYDLCVSWIEELLEELLEGGAATFGVPVELRKEILYSLQQAYPTMDPHEQLVVPTLVVQLAYAWDVKDEVALETVRLLAGKDGAVTRPT